MRKRGNTEDRPLYKFFETRIKLAVILILAAVGIPLLKYTLLGCGPNESGVRDFTTQILDQKYGIPPFSFTGNVPPKRVFTAINVIAYKKDPNGSGGTYLMKYHLETPGESKGIINGFLECHYDMATKTFILNNTRESK
jgi:hypothetical protein